MFFRPRNDKVYGDRDDARCGVRRRPRLVLHALRVARHRSRGDGLDRVGAARALRRCSGSAATPSGYYLIKNGGRTPARKWGYWAIATSTGIAGALLAIAAVTA